MNPHTMHTQPEWQAVCRIDEVPVLGARVIERGFKPDVAIFRNAENMIFALVDRCPHKGGPLSQGIVFGERVACPLHNWNIALLTGCAVTPDEGCTQRFSLKLENEQVWLDKHELNGMRIVEGDFNDPQVLTLLRVHLQGMHASSPACSVHALDLSGLQASDISFWTAWQGDNLLGCAALRAMNAHEGEIKSMRSAEQFLRQGAARRLLNHLEDLARTRGYTKLWLETGTAPAFLPAHALYKSVGFKPCTAFGAYVPDVYSCYMSKDL